MKRKPKDVDWYRTGSGLYWHAVLDAASITLCGAKRLTVGPRSVPARNTPHPEGRCNRCEDILLGRAMSAEELQDMKYEVRSR